MTIIFKYVKFYRSDKAPLSCWIELLASTASVEYPIQGTVHIIR